MRQSLFSKREEKKKNGFVVFAFWCTLLASSPHIIDQGALEWLVRDPTMEIFHLAFRSIITKNEAND